MPDVRLLMQSAAAYKLADRILVHPWNTTTSGVGIAGEPYLTLPPEADHETLGISMLRALAACREGVPHPSSWKGLAAPRLKAAGVRSEAAFAKMAFLVTVSQSGRRIVCEPSRNGGVKGSAKGFEPLPDLSVLAAGIEAVEIGSAVRAAFAKCM